MLFKNNTDSNHLSFDVFILDWKKKQVTVKKCGNINAIIDSSNNETMKKISVSHSSQDGQKKDTATTPSDSSTCSNLKPLHLNVYEDGKSSSISALVRILLYIVQLVVMGWNTHSHSYFQILILFENLCK